jgi:lambda repressor-like predicted transcriptional regulator
VRTAQEDFALSVRKALLDRGWTVKELSRRLALHRNTVDLALRAGLNRPTRRRIAKILGLPFPK